jgi:hypothetical protein
MALAVSKYVEIKTGLSIRRVTDALTRITNVQLVHRVTREVETLRSPLGPEMIAILEKLGLSH